MFNTCIIKNVSDEDIILQYQRIPISGTYIVSTSERIDWASGEDVLSGIICGDVIINNGSSDILNISDAIDYIKNISKKDNEGFDVMNVKYLHYDEKSLQFHNPMYKGEISGLTQVTKFINNDNDVPIGTIKFIPDPKISGELGRQTLWYLKFNNEKHSLGADVYIKEGCGIGFGNDYLDVYVEDYDRLLTLPGQPFEGLTNEQIQSIPDPDTGVLMYPEYPILKRKIIFKGLIEGKKYDFFVPNRGSSLPANFYMVIRYTSMCEKQAEVIVDMKIES